MKQCKYTVGIPRKEAGLYSYTIDITVTPNNSLVKTFDKIEKGTYYSLDAVSKDLVETMESYAKSPAYGKETTLSIPLNMTELLGRRRGRFHVHQPVSYHPSRPAIRRARQVLTILLQMF